MNFQEEIASVVKEIDATKERKRILDRYWETLKQVNDANARKREAIAEAEMWEAEWQKALAARTALREKEEADARR